ncbi:MAG: tetratricopeptide repeat protein [Ignavibacteriae bacterium]|nr:MAG: tetratricopeptide repeat protein [Ignavibacteriota bacterium]
MLKARKKITHKEIKKDKLVTAYFESKDWVTKEENKKKIYMIVGIIVVLVVVGYLYTSNRQTKSDDAETKLSNVITLIDENKYQEAINGDPATSTTGLNDIISNYGSTESGETAKFYLANCYYNLKDYDNALRNFEAYSGSNDIIKASCLSGQAAVYESKGDLKKAGELYEKSAKVNKDLVINEESLFNAIKTYAAAGDKESANRVLSTLKNDYPKSKYVNDIKRFEPEFKN